MTIDKTIINLEIGHTAEIGMHHTKAEEIMTEIIDQATRVSQEIISGETDTDKIIGIIVLGKITEETATEIITDKIMEEIIIGI